MLPDRQAFHSFRIVPSTLKTLLFVLGVLAFCVVPVLATAPLVTQMPALRVAWVVVSGISVFLFFILGSSQFVRFDLSTTGLRIRNSVFGRAVPLAVLLPEEARAVSLREEPQLKPVLRTMGNTLVGYREGWFRLRNGDKALLFVTDPTTVIDLPTREGYRILLSVPDPPRFLRTAHRIWGLPAPHVENAAENTEALHGRSESR